MKNYKKTLLSFITNVIRLITRPVYLLITITLIALFPAKKLTPTAPMIPINLKHNYRSFFICTEEIMERTRQILGLNLSPAYHLLLDKTEYFEEVRYLDLIEDMYLSSPDPREYLDYYEFLQDWQIDYLMKPIKEKYAKTNEELLPDIEFFSARIPTLSYFSLEYWPY
jgi:hypothetical protein